MGLKRWASYPRGRLSQTRGSDSVGQGVSGRSLNATPGLPSVTPTAARQSAGKLGGLHPHPTRSPVRFGGWEGEGALLGSFATQLEAPGTSAARPLGLGSPPPGAAGGRSLAPPPGVGRGPGTGVGAKWGLRARPGSRGGPRPLTCAAEESCRLRRRGGEQREQQQRRQEQRQRARGPAAGRFGRRGRAESRGWAIGARGPRRVTRGAAGPSRHRHVSIRDAAPRGGGAVAGCASWGDGRRAAIASPRPPPSAPGPGLPEPQHLCGVRAAIFSAAPAPALWSAGSGTGAQIAAAANLPAPPSPVPPGRPPRAPAAATRPPFARPSSSRRLLSRPCRPAGPSRAWRARPAPQPLSEFPMCALHASDCGAPLRRTRRKSLGGGV